MTTTTRPLPGHPSAPRLADPRLRRGALAYGATTAATILGLVLLARANGADVDRLDDASPVAQLALFGSAFGPAVGMLAAWWISGIRPDLGFRRVRPRTLGTAWLVAVSGPLLAYAVAWSTGLARFDSAEIVDSFGMPAPLAVLVGLGPGLIPWMALAWGEQIGWSSWLVARLGDVLDRRVLALVFGVGWCLAHVPLMLLIPNAVPAGIPTAFAACMFAVETIALAFPLVWLRRDSRSIWPVLVLHAGVNASMYFVGDLLTTNKADTAWFLGEGSLLTAAGTALAVVLTAPLWRKR